MLKGNGPIIRRTLFSWVFAGNFKLQLLLLLTVVVAVIARIVPLEMQKRIVNEAIEKRNIDLLVTYCTVYLASFVTASGLKFVINALQTVIGQNTLAEMRGQLYDHILGLPQAFFRKTQSGLIVSSMVTELATAGDLVGMAVAIPLANLLTLAGFAAYLFWLNPLLAVISFSIYPAVLFLIPRLQNRVNHYNRKRVDATRSFSGRLGESVEGIYEIKANGAAHIENRSLGRRIERLRKIRIRWNLYRFGVKVLNNLFANFGRFLIFSLGGYLALTGRLELGALVAFLSAQEKLYDPWKELIQFYQAYQTASVTYKRTMDYFAVAPETTAEAKQEDPVRLKGQMDVEGLSFTTEEGKALLQDATFALEPGEHMALVGGSGSGKSTLLHCLMGLYPRYEGRYELDGKNASTLGRRNMSANIGAVFQSPAIFSGSIEENLLYGCKALIGAKKDGTEDELPDLNARIEVLQQTGFFVDVLGFGLSSRFRPSVDEPIRDSVLDVRAEFQKKYADETAPYIEGYDKDRYLYHATVAENLLFGSPVDSRFGEDQLSGNPLFTNLLKQQELLEELTGLGRRFFDRILDVHGNQTVLPASLPLTIEDMESLRQSVKKTEKDATADLPEKHRRKLLGLALRAIPALSDLVEIPESLARRIVAARKAIMENLEEQAPGEICFFRPDAYITGATVLENILFGRITSEKGRAKTRIHTLINRLLVKEELLEAILEVGMQFDVGRGGENLSGGQRQKLALARSFLKKPPILLLDEATASLDNESQKRVQNTLESRWKGHSTLVASVHRLDIIENYDKIAVLKSGRIEEMGGYEELMKKKGLLHRLVQRKS